jgi:hypothetical protein
VDDLKYYFLTHPRRSPAGVLRTYRTGEIIHHEEYNFSKPGWVSSTYFADYYRGHMDYESEETTAEEAQAWIQEGLRAAARRERDEARREADSD